MLLTQSSMEKIMEQFTNGTPTNGSPIKHLQTGCSMRPIRIHPFSSQHQEFYSGMRSKFNILKSGSAPTSVPASANSQPKLHPFYIRVPFSFVMLIEQIFFADKKTDLQMLWVPSPSYFLSSLGPGGLSNSYSRGLYGVAHGKFTLKKKLKISAKIRKTIELGKIHFL
jgi:hypothetical protein